MSTRSLAALCSLALAAPQGGPPDEAPVTPPPPRAAIAGLSGFRTVSDVTDLVTEQAFELEVTHVFPDRCRVRRQRLSSHDRDFEYRSGGEVFLLPSGTLESRREERAPADEVLRRMELHRALFLWPEGFDWSPAKDGERRVTVRRSAADPESAVLGTLTATLDADGRPSRIAAVRADGSAAEAYEVLARSEDGDHAWPARLRLTLGGVPRWIEHVRLVDLDIERNDFAFLPHDRRPPPAPGLVAMDLQSFTFRRVPLEEPLDWPAALERYEELVAASREAVEAAGHALDPAPTFELDAQGRPTACLLRLAAPAPGPPEGWVTRPERTGLAWRRLRSLAEVTPARLKALLRAVPEDSRGEVPYLRRLSYGRLTFVDLYLPLALR